MKFAKSKGQVLKESQGRSLDPRTVAQIVAGVKATPKQLPRHNQKPEAKAGANKLSRIQTLNFCNLLSSSVMLKQKRPQSQGGKKVRLKAEWLPQNEKQGTIAPLKQLKRRSRLKQNPWTKYSWIS